MITITAEKADAISTAGLIKPLSSILVNFFDNKNPRRVPGIRARVEKNSLNPKRLIMINEVSDMIVPNIKMVESDPLNLGPFWCW